MTEITDIEVLREALKACDRHDYRTWPQLSPMRLESLLDQLEAEHQQREAAEFRVGVLEGVVARKEFDAQHTELAALRGEQEPVAYAIRNHFWKDGRANFQGKYHDLHFAENLKSAWDVQIPLFTTQPTHCVVLPARFKAEISKVEPLKGAPVMKLDPAGRWLNRTAVVLVLKAAGMVVKDGE